MATAPVKPQQLHNFPISLKWGQTTTTLTPSASAAAANHHHQQHQSTSGNNHNHRLTTTTTTSAHDSETESDPDQSQSTIRRQPPRVGSRSARVHRFSFASCSTLLPKAKPETQQKSEANEKQQQKNIAVLDDSKNHTKEDEAAAAAAVAVEEEETSRPWKLRPRRGILTSNKETATFNNINEQHQQKKERDNYTTQFQQPKSTRLRGLMESSSTPPTVLALGSNSNNNNIWGAEKKETKRKFWIALSREEIEEDVYALTGSRPARRPKKRPKNVQKALDCVFPGLWLVGTTADSYRIADPPVKR